MIPVPGNTVDENPVDYPRKHTWKPYLTVKNTQ
ncbi:hypothetical protein U746_3113 [Mycolicibacterium mucogenicum 261Sha1.1M5]|nr:hypothetical protein U746_3113 [Mycolicibacterium mucogenicum 261Sha1.1M5]